MRRKAKNKKPHAQSPDAAGVRPQPRALGASPLAFGQRSRWPTRRVVISICSLATAAAMVQAGWLEYVVGSIVDQAVGNIITLILGFSAAVSLLLWFVRESGHAARLKWMVAGGIMLALALGIATLRIERVSGDLVPEFFFRWNPSRDRLLTSGATERGMPGVSDKSGLSDRADARPTPAPTWTATPEDFNQFLGPAGSGGIDTPALNPDWQTQPPALLWKRPIGAGWGAFATCGDHAVTLEQRGDNEIVACYSLQSGEPEWSVAVPTRHETVLGGVGPRSTPTIHEGIVYTTGATGWLHGIVGATGQVLWKKNILAELGIDAAAHAAAVAWGRAGSPLISGELVIVPAGGPRSDGAVSLVAFDKNTGQQRWTAGSEQISYCTPALVTLAGRQVVMVVNEAHVAAYDPATGREEWQSEWPGHSNSDASCSQAIVVGERQFFVSKGYGIGAALFELSASDAKMDSVREVWHNAGQLKTKFSNAAVRDGHVYGLSDGILECVRLADGKRQWKAGRYGQGQVLRVGALLVVQAESGEVLLVDASPEKHAVRARLMAIKGQTWNNPCLSGDRLLVRNAEEAACFRLPLSADLNRAGTADTAGMADQQTLLKASR